MNRILAIAFILFCFEIGLFLMFAPWSLLWDHNFLLSFSPSLRAFALNNFVRGAVSGLGFVDCMLGLSELFRFAKSLRMFNRTSE
jgi:hypothetical protein